MYASIGPSPIFEATQHSKENSKITLAAAAGAAAATARQHSKENSKARQPRW